MRIDIYLKHLKEILILAMVEKLLNVFVLGQVTLDIISQLSILNKNGIL